MNKKRLITFGCSYPFGHGLPDCIGKDNVSPGKDPSNFAFPQLISNYLNRTNVNLSRPGSSNKEMIFRIQQFDFDKDDIVILHWTHSERSCVIDNENVNIIGHWCPDKRSKTFYKLFATNDDIVFNTKLYLSWANLYLKSKVKTTINTKPFTFLSNLDVDFSTDECSLLDKTINDFTIDYAIDNLHPGIKSHKSYAEYLQKQIME
jgi:hypothetical protein